MIAPNRSNLATRRNRTIRRLGVAGATVAVLALPAAALSDGADGADPLAGLSLPGTADYEQLAAIHPPEPVVPPTQAEIQASAEAYDGLSDQQALATLKSEHESTVEADLFPALDPPTGDEVTFISPTAAVVGDDLPSEAADDPSAPSFDPGGAPILPDESEQNVLIDSNVPIAAPEQGDLEPVDGDLTAEGDSFSVDNAGVEAEIPTELSDGIELGDVDTTVTPTSTDGAEAVPVKDKLFYPSSDTDTDTLVVPTPTGVEIFFQLRSPDAPTSQAIDIDVPAGASLVATEDGGAAVIDGAEPLVTIPPASALDAAGQVVPVDYSISGSELAVEAEIDAAKTVWPVLVDPIIDYYPWNEQFAQGAINTTNWYGHTSGKPNLIKVIRADGEGGVMNRFLAGSYASSDWSQWVATPIGQSYIETVEFFNTRNSPSTTVGACLVASVWSGANWTYGGVWDTRTGTAPLGYGKMDCTAFNNVSFAHYTGSNPYPDGENYADPESLDGSVGVFGLYSASGTRSNTAEDLLRSANVWRGDRNSPGIPALPTSSWSSAPQVPLTDAGLGVSGVGVYDPATSTWPGGAGTFCDGSHTAICPGSVTLPITGLPEGIRNYQLQAFDPLWNASPLVSWTARIDRSSPSISLGGSVRDKADHLMVEDGYGLDIHATDSVSGVERIDLFLDSDTAPTRTWTSDCPLAGGCTMDRPWSLPAGTLTFGDHELTVRATDAAGQTSATTLDLNVYSVGDAIDLRTSANFPASEAYVRTLLDTPTGIGALELWNAPMTSDELVEMDRRDDVAEALYKVDDWAAANAPSSYAGVFIDNHANGKAIVSFTQNTSANLNALRAMFPYPSALTGRTVDDSLASLTSITDTLTAEGPHLKANGITVQSAGVSVSANKVQAVVAPAPGDPAGALEAAYGPDVDASLGSVTADANVRDQDHDTNQAAGFVISMYGPNGGGLLGDCTEGFSARAAGSSDAVFTLTARHCGPIEARVTQSAGLLNIPTFTTLGKVSRTSQSIDTEAIRIDPVYTVRDVFRKRGKLLPVTKVENKGADHEGQYVCVSMGNSNKIVCGILAVTYATVEGYSNTRIMVAIAGGGGIRGDSGSPVYHPRKDGTAKAVGIYSGRVSDPAISCDNPCLYYTHVGRLEEHLDVKVVSR